ncbi:FCD domain-containing protein [Arthrobacter sp. CG_A4]|uniref:FCD domain-containing protein n=1 Tax=Arthrobacter sp. CG_A4 TaxID=3071706 RepID=UPI002E132939
MVPNLRGAQRAADCGLDELVVVVSADDEVSMRNQGLTVNEVLADLAKIGDLAQSVGTRLLVAVACAYFAPARGTVTREERPRVVEAVADAGAGGVYLAATSGEEQPAEMYEGVAEVRQLYPQLDLGVHLHNRNGFAPANALASMMAGATWLEESFGGLGGDMWFPGDPSVLGNVALEDLIHLCDGLGIERGIDLVKYMRVSDKITELTGRPSASFVSRGGTRADLAAAHWPQMAEPLTGEPVPEMDKAAMSGPGEETHKADETAYAQLRSIIVAGELPAGTWLRETSLAERMGVSRTPVREALNRLAAEGLVEISRNKGAQIFSFSPEDVTELYDVRAGFEPHAARLAVPRLDNDDVAHLAALSARMEEAVAAGKLSELNALNSPFHGIFVEQCGNRHFAMALQAVMRPALVAHTFRIYSPEALKRSMLHHAELVAAAEARDGEWAEVIMRQHIRAAKNAAGARPSTR